MQSASNAGKLHRNQPTMRREDPVMAKKKGKKKDKKKGKKGKKK